MGMRMESEVSCPGMQDASNGEQSPKTVVVRPQAKERLCGSLKEDIENSPGVGPCQGSELGRQSEADMHVAGGQCAAFSFSDPACLGQVLTFGAVAVPAGVVRRSFMPAVFTDVLVPSERRGATSQDIAQCFVLIRRENIAFDIGLTVFPEDFSGLQRRPLECRGWAGCPLASHSALPQDLAFWGADQIQGAFRFADMCGADLCVPGRCSDRTMPQQDLDGADVRSGFKQMCGKRMSEHMRGNTFSQARGVNCFFQRIPNRGGTDGAIGLLSGEEPGLWRAELFPIGTQEHKEPVTEHDVSITASFSVPDMNKASPAVNVVNLKGTGLGDAHSGAVGGHQDGPVFDGLDGIEKPYGLGPTEDIRQWPWNFWISNVDDFLGTPKGVGVEELDGRYIQLQVLGTSLLFLFQMEQELADFFFSQFLRISHEIGDEILGTADVIAAGRGPVLPQCQVFCHSVTILSHGPSPFSKSDARLFEHLVL